MSPIPENVPSLELGPRRPKFVIRFAFNNPAFLPPELPVHEEDREAMLNRAAKREGKARDSGPVVDRDIEMVDAADMVDDLVAAGLVLVSGSSRKNYNLDHEPGNPQSTEWYYSTSFAFYLREQAEVKDAERTAISEQVLRRMLGEALWTVNRVYDNPLHKGEEIDYTSREGQIHLNAPKRLRDAQGAPIKGRRPQPAATAVVMSEDDCFYLRIVRWKK